MSKTSSESIFSQLKDEHDQVKSLLKKAQDCDHSERQNILNEIESELIPHARAEEKTLYSLLLQKAQDQELEEGIELGNEAYEEHRLVDELISTLKTTDVDDDLWLARLNVLQENIEHHIEEEEDELFSFAKKLFSNSELKNLLPAYRESKETYQETLPSQSQIQARSASSSAKKAA